MRRNIQRLMLPVLLFTLGVAMGAFAEEKVNAPVRLEAKNKSLAVEEVVSPVRKSDFSSRTISPAIGGTVPPAKIGDLKCGLASKEDWNSCKAQCQGDYPEVPCVASCFYRKDQYGNCVLWAKCMECKEVPEDLPTNPSPETPR